MSHSPRHMPRPGEKTQREAIYEIIKEVLGDRFDETKSMVELVRGKGVGNPEKDKAEEKLRLDLNALSEKLEKPSMRLKGDATDEENAKQNNLSILQPRKFTEEQKLIARFILDFPSRPGPQQYNSEVLNKVVVRVFKGIKQGSIKSKYSDCTDKKIEAFARKIIHYWLTHDPRYNGGKKYSPSFKRATFAERVAFGSYPEAEYKFRTKIENNEDWIAINKQLSELDPADNSDRRQIVELRLQIASAVIVLEELGVWWRLSETIQNQIKLKKAC